MDNEKKHKQFWAKIASKSIRAEMAKHDMSYRDLVQKLENMNININDDDLRSRVSKGTFSATLFIQCLKAMEVKAWLLEDSLFEDKEKK